MSAEKVLLQVQGLQKHFPVRQSGSILGASGPWFVRSMASTSHFMTVKPLALLANRAVASQRLRAC